LDIGFGRPKLVSFYAKRNEQRILAERIDFARHLAQLIKSGEKILYVDETTINTW
jgi:hypothetical protein